MEHIRERFDDYELELEDTEERYQIFGHLKTGGVQCIAEVMIADFDTRAEAEYTAEYIYTLLKAHL